MVKYAKPTIKTATATTVKPAKGRSQQARIRGSVWQTIRARILRRDCGLCLTCKAAGRLTIATEVDHKLPLEDGGSNGDHNLASICHDCHAAKTAAENAARQGR